MKELYYNTDKNHSKLILMSTWRIIIFFICLLCSSCNSGSSAPSSTSEPTTQSMLALGSLPNGASVYVSAPKFTLGSSQSTSGALVLIGGTKQEKYAFSFQIVSKNSINMPSITTRPDSCVLGSGDLQQCTLHINGNLAQPGEYKVITSYQKVNSANIQKSDTSLKRINYSIESGDIEQLVESFSIEIANYDIYNPGYLSISPFSNSEIMVTQPTQAVVTLNNSIGITSPINVNIGYNNLIVSESSFSLGGANTCELTTLFNNCMVQLTGLNSGTTSFNASANNYTTALSLDLTVVSQGVVTYSSNLGYGTYALPGSTIAITAKISSGVGEYTVSANDLSAYGITLESESCTMSANSSCTLYANVGTNSVPGTYTYTMQINPESYLVINSSNITFTINPLPESSLHMFVTGALFPGNFGVDNALGLCGSDPNAPENAESMTWKAASSVTNAFESGYNYIYTNNVTYSIIFPESSITPNIISNLSAQALLYKYQFNSQATLSLWGYNINGSDCNDWSSTSSKSYGGFYIWNGSVNYANTSLGCNKTLNVFCVQQP